VLLRAAWCGDVRLRVAQFLANLWQGSCVVVYGANTGAIVPAALDHNDWHLRCTAVFRNRTSGLEAARG
jgi:hypothetical protein